MAEHFGSIPHVYDGSSTTEIFWFITVIGGVIATVLCLILIVNLVRLRCLLYPTFDALSYYMMIAIYASFCICGVFAALLRSNIIVSIKSFPICTHIMLATFQLFWCFGKLFCTLYYIYRIHIIFENSAFNIERNVLIVFILFTVFSGCVGIIMLPVVSYNNMELAISRNGYKHCQMGARLNFGFTALLIIEGCLHGLVNIILIYLFVSKLFVLVQGMIPISEVKASQNNNTNTYNTFEVVEHEHDNDDLYQVEESVERSKEITREISKKKSAIIIQIAKQSFISVSDTVDKKRYLSDDLSERRVEKMTRLMAKQTILVILYISSTSLIFFGQIIYPFFGYLVPYDIMINVLCIWFSLKSADHVWNLLVTGCSNMCCCCYFCCKCDTHSDNIIIQTARNT